VAVNNTPISLDLNLQYLGVFGAGKLFEGQTTFGTLRLLQNNIFMALGEMGFNGATMANRATLLSTLTPWNCLGAAFARFALLALAAKESLLQIAHLSQCQVQ